MNVMFYGNGGFTALGYCRFTAHCMTRAIKRSREISHRLFLPPSRVNLMSQPVPQPWAGKPTCSLLCELVLCAHPWFLCAQVLRVIKLHGIWSVQKKKKKWRKKHINCQLTVILGLNFLHNCELQILNFNLCELNSCEVATTTSYHFLLLSEGIINYMTTRGLLSGKCKHMPL